MIHTLMVDQPSFDGFCPVTDAVEQLAHHSCDNKRGAVFTKPEVVEFMLDLAGYTADKPLHNMRLLEPSFGGGEFLIAAVRRLLCAYDSAGNDNSIDLSACLRGVELHHSTFVTTKAKLAVLVTGHGFSTSECSRLISAWLISADFLLLPIQGRFDFVVGNPPYVRQEMIPPALLHQYRRLYITLYDRADLYVPFLERSLSLLTDGGQLAFICADRWTKNKYGGPLRAMVSDGFHLRAYVDMVGTKAFDSDVTAYPAITLIERTKGGATMVSERPEIDGEKLTQLAKALRTGKPVPELGITLVERAGVDSEPWVLTTSDARALLRRLEARFPTLEDTGCKVGIGVATGADKTFIAPMCELDVEPSRKLALVTTQDIASGSVRWRGLGVINPFEDDGKLVDLSVYPKLMAYLDLHREAIMARHVAQKSPANWYRTIDRITPSLAALPKLLIPDIKGSAHVVFEDGKLYPHHNLYFVVAEHWDLRALQAVLLSKVARQFVASYSTTMRGGFLRFQAQYLRRIRLPFWNEVSVAMRVKLVKAATELDLVQCDEAVFELYELSPSETALLARN